MPVTSPSVNKIIVGNANLEAPRRESGKDSPVKGGGLTPPDKKISVRQGMHNKMPITATRMSDATTGDKQKLLADKLDPKGLTRDGAALGKLRDQTLQATTGGNKTLNEALGPPPDKQNLLADKLDPKGLPRDGAALGGLRDEALKAARDDHKTLNEALASPRQLSASLLTNIEKCMSWSPKAFPSRVDEQAGWAQTLMSRAAELDDLAVELLMERKGLLGGEFATMTREQMAKARNDAPLAKLSPEDRMQLAALRTRHQKLMDLADRVVAAQEPKEAQKGVEALHKKLKANVAACEKRLSALIAKTPNKSAWQGLLDDALAGKTLSSTDQRISRLLEYKKETDKEGTGKKKGEDARFTATFEKSIAGLFNAVAMMRQEEMGLARGGDLARVTLALRATGARLLPEPIKTKFQYNDASLTMGLALLRQSAANGKPIGAPGYGTGFDTVLAKADPLLTLFAGKGASREAPKSDAAALKLLTEIMPLPKKSDVDPKQEMREVNALVWKFSNALRFNQEQRFFLGLTTNIGPLLFNFASRAPLSNTGKSELYEGLKKTFAAHFPELPTNVVEIESFASGKSKPKIVKMDGWDQPVLLKNVPAENEKIRELAFNSLMRNNPNTPKLLGVALPKGGNLLDERAALIFETVPGKDLDNFVPGMSDARSNLLTDMPPLARARAAVHLVSGTLRGLAPLHATGLTHGDLRPGNLMLNSNTLEACLIDFGSMARNGEATLTTLGYRPEDAPVASPALDIYSLGITLLELSYGKKADVKFGHQYLPYINADKYWQENGDVGRIQTAAKIMCYEDQAKRPTTEQLLAIIEGRATVPPADKDKGGASPQDLAVLREVFGPEGLFTGGRDEIASRMQ